MEMGNGMMSERTLQQEFEILEHTADIAVKASGSTPEDLFARLWKGTVYMIFNGYPESATEQKKFLHLTAFTLEDLLIDFLNEILYWIYYEKLVPMHKKDGEFQVIQGEQWRLEGEFLCSKVDFQEYPLQMDIKAATYHNLRISKRDGKLETTVVFDI